MGHKNIKIQTLITFRRIECDNKNKQKNSICTYIIYSIAYEKHVAVLPQKFKKVKMQIILIETNLVNTTYICLHQRNS